LPSLFAIGRSDDLMAETRERGFENQTRGSVVFGNKDAHGLELG
jgi:hypothetical protein